MPYLAPFLELSIKRWDVIMAVNVRGPMLMSRAFLPDMIDRGCALCYQLRVVAPHGCSLLLVPGGLEQSLTTPEVGS